MNAHVSSILLGVRDMDRSKRVLHGGSRLEGPAGTTASRCSSSRTAARSSASTAATAWPPTVGTSPEGSGFSGLVLTYVVRSEARVDEIMAEAEKAGATILKPAATLQWGGYGGSFADPDGYIWSIGYSAQGKDQPYAE